MWFLWIEPLAFLCNGQKSKFQKQKYLQMFRKGIEYETARKRIETIISNVIDEYIIQIRVRQTFLRKQESNISECCLEI